MVDLSKLTVLKTSWPPSKISQDSRLKTELFISEIAEIKIYSDPPSLFIGEREFPYVIIFTREILFYLNLGQ